MKKGILFIIVSWFIVSLQETSNFSCKHFIHSFLKYEGGTKKVFRPVDEIILKIPGDEEISKYLKKNLFKGVALFAPRQVNVQILCAEISI